MQLIQVDHAGRPELQSTDVVTRRARLAVIPRADEQIVLRTSRRARRGQVRAIVSKRTRLVSVVVTSDGEDRNFDPRILLTCRVASVPISIDVRMSEPLLESRRGQADGAIQLG